MSSFEKINYSLRPNKCVERKMMCDALTRLSLLDHIDQYRYIGMGSPYFADFVLFHKLLGITNLDSIEKEESKKERFDFNIPYAGINMHYGYSSTILPNLKLNEQKNIVWLDYDDLISDFMFGDIDTFFLNAMPGSVFIVSFSVQQESNIPESNLPDDETPLTLPEYRMQQLIDRIGKSRLPVEYSNINLTTKNNMEVCHEMINRQIKNSLITRNGHNSDAVEYQQIFNFEYKDNAAILTLGGIIYEKSQKSLISKMAFDKLPFVRTGNDRYKIDCPNLTIREIKALDKALPDAMKLNKKGKFENEKLKLIPLPAADIKNYSKVYRYYPNYSEISL